MTSDAPPEISSSTPIYYLTRLDVYPAVIVATRSSSVWAAIGAARPSVGLGAICATRSFLELAVIEATRSFVRVRRRRRRRRRQKPTACRVAARSVHRTLLLMRSTERQHSARWPLPLTPDPRVAWSKRTPA
jgi:hypothetical protein